MHHPLVRMPLALIGLAGLWTCDDSTTLVLEPNPATRIVIQASSCPSQLARCSGCQLEFDAFDKNSQPALFPTVLWTSSNPAVASVDETGRVQAWALGEVTVEAEVLETGASDAIQIEVVPPFTTVTCTAPGNLSVPPAPATRATPS